MVVELVVLLLAKPQRAMNCRCDSGAVPTMMTMVQGDPEPIRLELSPNDVVLPTADSS